MLGTEYNDPVQRLSKWNCFIESKLKEEPPGVIILANGLAGLDCGLIGKDNDLLPRFDVQHPNAVTPVQRINYYFYSSLWVLGAYEVPYPTGVESIDSVAWSSSLWFPTSWMDPNALRDDSDNEGVDPVRHLGMGQCCFTDGHAEARHDRNINAQGPPSESALFLVNSRYWDPLQR